MNKFFFNDAFNEFAQTYIDSELNFLKKINDSGQELLKKKYFFKRPFLSS